MLVLQRGKKCWSADDGRLHRRHFISVCSRTTLAPKVRTEVRHAKVYCEETVSKFCFILVTPPLPRHIAKSPTVRNGCECSPDVMNAHTSVINAHRSVFFVFQEDMEDPGITLAREERQKQLLKIESYLQVFRDYNWCVTSPG